LSEIRVKAAKPLPEPLPEGEQMLWQHSPAWLPYSRRAFQIGKIGFYFLVIVGWVAISAYISEGNWLAVLRSLTWAVPPAVGVLAVLALIGWFYARTTVYTITNKRVIIQSGLAVPSAVNLPFAKIDSADMKMFDDATGDIELTISGARLLYSMLWPNVRFLRLNRPRPVLRAICHPRKVSDILGQALAADQKPAAAATRHVADDDMQPNARRAATS